MSTSTIMIMQTYSIFPSSPLERGQRCNPDCVFILGISQRCHRLHPTISGVQPCKFNISHIIFNQNRILLANDCQLFQLWQDWLYYWWKSDYCHHHWHCHLYLYSSSCSSSIFWWSPWLKLGNAEDELENLKRKSTSQSPRDRDPLQIPIHGPLPQFMFFAHLRIFFVSRPRESWCHLFTDWHGENPESGRDEESSSSRCRKSRFSRLMCKFSLKDYFYGKFGSIWEKQCCSGAGFSKINFVKLILNIIKLST